MKKPAVLVVFGTRPEVIKLAPVIRELERRPDLRVVTCATAQHRQMLDGMLRSFGLRPDHDLDLMQPNQDLSGFSARALPRLQAVLREVRPAYALVQGDTTTAFITALAAFHERVPVGHVEAGLRSRDLQNPWPEEANRAMISRICDLHFAPTRDARDNLAAEGIAPAAILQTGNTVVDALRWCAARPHRFREPLLRQAAARLGSLDKVVLVTTHRRENHGAPLESLCRAFDELVRRHDDLHLFYPVHMNPAVQVTVRRLLRHPRAHLLPALDYFDLVHLLRRSCFVLTDSGGLQEEAPSLGKPVVVLRKVTERPEAVRAGAAALAGTEPAAVVALATRLLRDPAFHRSMSRARDVYGDGRAGARVADAVRHRLGLSPRRPADFRSSTAAPAAPRHEAVQINSPAHHGGARRVARMIPA